MSDERVCLGCGETAEGTSCPRCGRPLMKRGVPAGLGLADLGPDEPTALMPAEVEEAARRPENPFAGKYVLLRKIGKGGMGSVWKAWEIPLARFVAIKFLNVPSGDDILRFEREAKLAASLSHPNIAPIYEFGRSQGESYLVMKFIDGRTLHDLALEGPALVKAMIPACEAVHHAHESGVIHRDLKPHNIMLSVDDRPYVMDFGLAKQVEGGEQLSLTDMVVGTPSYMSPEQAQGQRDRIDRRSDVYSLGATLYHLATGRPPFVGDSPLDILVNVLKADVVAPRRHNPALPPSLEAIILKAMEKDPGRRYASGLDLAADLKRLAAGETVTARLPFRRFIPRPLRRNPALFAALALAGLAVAVALRLASTPPARDGWRDRFARAREPFARPDFAVAETAGLANLARIAPDGEAASWFREQATRGRERIEAWESAGRPTWRGKREDALRLASWARALRTSLDGLPAFVKEREAFEAMAVRAARLAAFRGLAVLRIRVFPDASVRTMKAGTDYFIRDGRIELPDRGRTPDGDLSTPLVIEDLEIDDYEVELVHPVLGAKTLTLRDMQDGGDYLLRGSLAEGGTLQLTAAR